MTRVRTIPADADQLLFLSRVQRLLDSGRFSATYKFALFLAIAELAVERGDDSDARLRIPLEAIADRFVALYWRQAAPFQAANASTVLRQNSGKNAEIITKIAEAHGTLDLSLSKARNQTGWTQLLQDVKRIVVTMPLLKLQTIGRKGKSTRTECFLYPNTVRGDEIELRQGVAFCLRRFFPILQGMVRSKWLSWVQGQNNEILGSLQELESFMFGANRKDNRGIRETLFEIQGGRCFYRPRVRLNIETAQVDHFVPWAKYPCDAATNFVLASPKANSEKKDYLPAPEYLERWCNRNRMNDAQLDAVARSAGLDSRASAVERIAAWAYASHEAIGGLVWHASRRLIPLDSRWRQILFV
jgi:hypothetical protein